MSVVHTSGQPIGFHPSSVPEREHPEYDDDDSLVPCFGTGYAGYSARGTTDDEEEEETFEECGGHCQYCRAKAKWDFRLAVVRTSAAVVAVMCAVVAVVHSL